MKLRERMCLILGIVFVFTAQAAVQTVQMNRQAAEHAAVVKQYEVKKERREATETELFYSQRMVENQKERIYDLLCENVDANAEIERLSASVVLPVELIYQYPELANGCEVTSATMVLNYWGYNANKVTMADIFLPKQYPYYNADPNVAFMGDPHIYLRGYYCFAAPLTAAVNNYLDSVGDTKMRAKDITGAGVEELKEYIKAGYPIVFWGTLGFGGIRYSRRFVMQNGNRPYSSLHCLVLRGYDEEYMYISDPLGINSRVRADTFEYIYYAMGQRAVLISNI